MSRSRLERLSFVLAVTIVAGALAAATPALARQQPPAPPQAGASQPAPAGSPPRAEGGEPSRVVGPPRGAALSGDALLTRTEEVAGLLRCPVCQGLSVADSPATMAVNMKAQVKDLLAQGYDEEQILAHFESSYGEFVRLEPKLSGVNWLVWLGPLLALALGGAVVALALRARRAPASTGAENAPALPGPDTLPDDPELARYVRRVRELAYGWPEGRRPGAA
jgi:cytochrome c-type biogenesis protein CcmH